MEGLLNGQSLDLHYSTLPRTLETTDRVARGKTVSMIRLTLVLPAILGNAATGEIRQIERIALFWGLGYQIVDDLKDVLQSEEQSGKTPARDVLLGQPEHRGSHRNPWRRSTAHAIHRPGRQNTATVFVASRPELDFLERLRGELQHELATVTRNSCELAEEVQP